MHAAKEESQSIHTQKVVGIMEIKGLFLHTYLPTSLVFLIMIIIEGVRSL